MTQDFAEFLRQTPEAARKGRVFGIQISIKKAGRIISAIGQKAGVITATSRKADPESLGGRSMCPNSPVRRSAPGVRVRWSRKFRPNTLKQLMRHASIQTTMDFYALEDEDAVAAEVWSGSGNSPGNSAPIEPAEDAVTQ